MRAGLRGLWQEERGVSVVIGAMLMMLVVAAMWGTIQVYHVPNWNKDVEYEHLNMVHDDMMTFKSDVEDVAILEAPKTCDFHMGVRYPSRMFLANPGTGVAGSLSSENVAISIVYTTDGLGDPTITENYISNRVIYEVQGTADSPKLVYEHGLIIRDYGNEYATTDEQSLIIGDEIYLPVLTGNLTSVSSMETDSIEIKPLPLSYSRTDIKSVEITIDTGYPEVWEQLFAGIGTGYTTVASDDFESGDWAGGTGWLDDWYSSGDAAVTASGTPYEGSYHLRLRRATGYVDRAVDLSGAVSARLRFWAKANYFESGEEAYCLISDNDVDWTTVHTWVDGDDDDQYRFHDIDLTPYDLSSQFWIAFEANMSGGGDYFYVDKLEIIATYAAGTTVDVDLDEGEIIINSTLIKQISMPAGDVTADALYAGLTIFSTTSVPEPVFIIGGGTGTSSLHRTATRYVPMFNAGRSATESDVQQPVPVAGTVSSFYVTLDGSPGSGNSYTFVVRKNGEDTPVTCIISDADTTGSDLTDSVSFDAGDYISIMVTPASNPTARSMSWTAQFSPDQ